MINLDKNLAKSIVDKYNYNKTNKAYEQKIQNTFNKFLKILNDGEPEELRHEMEFAQYDKNERVLIEICDNCMILKFAVASSDENQLLSLKTYLEIENPEIKIDVSSMPDENRNYLLQLLIICRTNLV